MLVSLPDLMSPPVGIAVHFLSWENFDYFLTLVVFWRWKGCRQTE